ncbi:MAG: hypothetical protein JWO59_2102 [Chloroflexi bacterium]|jgi:hypothetical protein|nr:hypothetical protein [Chloroflexota bacterium]
MHQVLQLARLNPPIQKSSLDADVVGFAPKMGAITLVLDGVRGLRRAVLNKKGYPPCAWRRLPKLRKRSLQIGTATGNDREGGGVQG